MFDPLCIGVSMSTSSNAFWPTSPIHKFPVAWSIENRNGLRRPYNQISFAAVAFATKGLSLGILYVPLQVAAAPAVAQADVKKSVVAESQAAPIVICLRLIDRE